MWTRELLKNNAKKVLAFSYWRSFLVCFVAGFFLLGEMATPAVNHQINERGGYQDFFYSAQVGFLRYSGPLLVAALMVLVIGLAWMIFVMYPVEAGRNRYFMEARVGKAPFGTLFSVFTQPGLVNVSKTLFFRGLYTFFWSLLFIIPGIYKAYEYRMVSYIIAENPHLPTERAFELSRRMMQGEKMNTFVLDLSFFGWMILCAFTFGIGYLFLAPYMQATYAELYAVMRAKAFANGDVTENELRGFAAY